MAKSNLKPPDFTEDLVSFMVQMILTIGRFPRAPFAMLPLSKKEERAKGADVKIESIAPLYLQFKRPFAYPGYSTANYIRDRKKLKLTVDPQVLYFELRAKKPHHKKLQHNALFELRNTLQTNGTGDAVYVAPLFLSRTAYLLSVHLHSVMYWRPWHLLHHHPFGKDDLEIITKTGSIRFQNHPILRDHISIPPHARVKTHKHRYSYLEDGSEVCFHSPSIIETTNNLGQFVYDFMKFRDGQPTTKTINIKESTSLLHKLEEKIFGESFFENNQSILEGWLDFGDRLKREYDIEQYMLIKWKNNG